MTQQTNKQRKPYFREFSNGIFIFQASTSLSFVEIPITDDFEVLGVTIDDKLKFEKHVAKVCRKVSRQVAVLKRMKKLLPFEERISILHSFFPISTTTPKPGTSAVKVPVQNWKK